MSEMYGSPVINFTAFLEIERNEDGTVTILRHFRLHNTNAAQGAHEHPETLGGFYLLESPGRIAKTVRLFETNEYLTVANPKHVFSYPE